MSQGPEPNTKASVAFLRKWTPAGPWTLTAIVPEGGKTWTMTFAEKTLDAMKSWIDSHQGVNNIYFAVNPLLTYMSSKAKKTDVKEVAWLHVDIDPRDGEDLEAERKTILAKLTAFTPKPTVVVFSGGGYQAFWRLSDPIPINGDPKLAVEAEAYNKQLEILLGADRCHNVDRIMRLPGTINVPGEKKRNAGRVPALA